MDPAPLEHTAMHQQDSVAAEIVMRTYQGMEAAAAAVAVDVDGWRDRLGFGVGLVCSCWNSHCSSSSRRIIWQSSDCNAGGKWRDNWFVVSPKSRL